MIKASLKWKDLSCTFLLLIDSNQNLSDHSQDVIEKSVHQANGCAAWKPRDSIANKSVYFRIC